MKREGMERLGGAWRAILGVIRWKVLTRTVVSLVGGYRIARLTIAFLISAVVYLQVAKAEDLGGRDTGVWWGGHPWVVSGRYFNRKFCSVARSAGHDIIVLDPSPNINVPVLLESPKQVFSGHDGALSEFRVFGAYLCSLRAIEVKTIPIDIGKVEIGTYCGFLKNPACVHCASSGRGCPVVVDHWDNVPVRNPSVCCGISDLRRLKCDKSSNCALECCPGNESSFPGCLQLAIHYFRLMLSDAGLPIADLPLLISDSGLSARYADQEDGSHHRRECGTGLNPSWPVKTTSVLSAIMAVCGAWIGGEGRRPNLSIALMFAGTAGFIASAWLAVTGG